MLGAIIGDIVGSAYEFSGLKRKDFAPLFHAKARFTDDTVCTIAIVDCLVNDKAPANALREWCRRYQNVRGWGQRFARWFIADELKPPYGSYGNGAAMRIGPVGFLAKDEEQVVAWATEITSITHNHPEALAAARATALAIYWLRRGHPAAEIRDALQDRFAYDLSKSVEAIRPTYFRPESRIKSVPQALVCALQATDFEDAIRNAVSLGGDCDTQAAIAGSLAEARFGIPEDIARLGWQYLPNDMRDVLLQAYQLLPKTISAQ